MRTLTGSGISARLGSVQALDDVSLSLEAGKVTLLAGPNGAGKTTLIRVLLGLVRPDAGSFAADGETVAVDRAWKRRIGYLPEAVAFSGNLTGQQVLRFFARARGVGKERVAAVLEQVGLGSAGRRAVRGYSRGMRQRLGLGVAILASPELLILDEPTAGLDQEGLSVLWSILDACRRSGRLVLMSTHDLALSERRVDDLCLLRAGRLLARGTASELRRAANLGHRVTFELEDTDTAGIQLLHRSITQWGKGRVELAGARLIVATSPDSILELMQIQSRFPGTVRSLRVEEPSLDLVYNELLEAV